MARAVRTTRSAGLSPETQARQVGAHFRDSTAFWHDLYARQDSVGAVFRNRQEVALSMVDGAGLPAAARVLEVGCGAGHCTVELARRGLRVTAIDAAEEMLEVAGGVLEANGLSTAVDLQRGDVHGLGFDNCAFRLVVALGVIPWLHSPVSALAEMARVLEPGGYLVVTSDNRARLNHLLDPVFSPVTAGPLRAISSAWRTWRGIPSDLRFHPHLIWARKFRGMLNQAGLEVVEERTVGFGPFSFLAHPVLDGPAGAGVHRKLQALADHGVPLLRSAGCHQVVLARKPR